MAVLDASDGIKIGQDNTGYDRLALLAFDEWVVTDGDERIIGTLAAGEKKTLVFTGVMTAQPGARVFAQPLNFGLVVDGWNYDTLLIRGAWVSNINEISVLVQNDSANSVTYNEDQWSLMHFNTASNADSGS